MFLIQLSTCLQIIGLWLTIVCPGLALEIPSCSASLPFNTGISAILFFEHGTLATYFLEFANVELTSQVYSSDRVDARILVL